MTKPSKRFLTFTEARELVRSLGLGSVREWERWRRHRPANLPSNPYLTYSDTWVSWSDFLGLNLKLSFAEARAYTHTLGLRSSYEWHKHQRPDNIPADPPAYYKEAWQGWADFLGPSYDPYAIGHYLPFEEARAFVVQQNLRSSHWFTWFKQTQPQGIPSRPDRVYPDQWVSWSHWVGNC